MYEANRMRRVQSPIIPVVHQLIREHPGTISFGQGVVHYGPPADAMRRIRDFAGDPDNHKYKDVAGILELLELCKHKLQQDNGIAVGPDKRIVITAGANMAFMNAVFAITDPGDEIILPTPFYFNHEMAIMMADCRPVPVASDANYQLDIQAIERAITPRTRGIVTVSPNNPTGAVYSSTVLRQVNTLCAQRGIYHISDEAYEYFTFDGASHFSPGSIDTANPHTISLFSLSKSYGFASWRVGYMVIPENLLFAIKKAQDTVLICPPVICQHAATAAMQVGSDYCRANLTAYDEVRALVLNELESLSCFVSVPQAKGAFYFLLRVDAKCDAMTLVESLIRQFGVAVIPGTTFGIDGCYLRISYGALEKQTVAEGVGRLVRGLKKLVGDVS